MHVHTQDEEGELKQATQNDPRVTLVGRFIRRTSIDELPQLFNVLKGNMSLVGPRPHAVQHDADFAKKIEAYFARHMIKPGITGLAQVNGYRGETETVEKMKGRFDYDLHYINNWSIALDLKILVKTVFMFCSSKAY
jgi:putative colanic acid biosynthesis UDP-glucose lipid carrier transferase